MDEKLIEICRGDLVESSHQGHIVISDNEGNLRRFWGNPDEVIYPRSSCKMIQALPLVETGSADFYNLDSSHLALACASHSGGEEHLKVAKDWLQKIKLETEDLLCGSHRPEDKEERRYLNENRFNPTQLHNNCSGKHLGFLAVSKFIEGDKYTKKNYVSINHPVQEMVKKVFEDLTGVSDPKFGLDGCSAPNFTCTVKSLARSMANLANPIQFRNERKIAITRLKDSALRNPHLIAGKDRLCTKLMKKSAGRFIVKVGAEGVYTAILLEEGLGVALKVTDGSSRAAECLIVTILVRFGLLNEKDPEIDCLLRKPIINWANHITGFLKATENVWERGTPLI